MPTPNPYPRLLDVLDTLGAVITTAVNAAGIKNDLNADLSVQVGPGTVIATKIATILGSGHGKTAVALWPLKSRNHDRYSPEDEPRYTPPSTTLRSVVSGSTITFSGTPMPANVHVVVNGEADAHVSVGAINSLASVATATATAINALALPGITATPSGAAVSTTGLYDLTCNVGGVNGLLQREQVRVGRMLIVKIYSPDYLSRMQVGDAIIKRVGTSDNHFYALSDGQWLYCRYAASGGDELVEKAQSSYSAFEQHICFDLEYPETADDAVVQVGVVESALQVGVNNTPVTSIISADS